MSRRLLFLTWIGVVALGVSVKSERAMAQASNSDEEARVHFRLGQAYYDSGRFSDAAREFEEAYRLSNRAQLLYNIFLAHRDAGNMGPMIDALRNYLQLVPTIADRDQLEARLANWERVYQEQQTEAQRRQAEAAPSPTVVSPPVAPAEPAAAPASTPTTSTSEPAAQAPASTPAEPAPLPETASAQSDSGPGLVPWIVMGGGGALIAGGVVTGIMALGKKSDLESACTDGVCPPELRSEADSGKTLALMTDILVGAGIAAVGVGAALLIFGGGDDDSESRPVSGSASCGPDGCGASVRWAF